MVLVDSNILVYAINSRSPKNEKSQKFLQNSTGNFSVAHQNILETIRVLTHPKFSNPMIVKDAISVLEPILKTAKIVSPEYKTHEITLELIRKYELSSDEIFDAYLVATALANDINKIATDNEKDFSKIKEIKIVNPFESVGKRES